MEHNCHIEPIQKTVSAEERETVETVFLEIQGMGCPNCAIRVYNRLIVSTGVVDARVDHIRGIAQVTFNPNLMEIPKLLEAVAEAGNDGRHSYYAALITT